MSETPVPVQTDKNDTLTVIALSLLAYIAAVFLHEDLGHATTCWLLGGRVSEIGAFYINCQYGSLPDLSIRLVAFAGPLVSFLTGGVGFLALNRFRRLSAQWTFAIWLFSTIGFMTATGYLLFSGISGLGDFGTSRDGLLFQLQPEWLWRIVITLLGTAGYVLTIRVAVRAMDKINGGAGGERVKRAQKLSLSAYLTGGVYYILVGLLNPQGIVIVLVSSVASSLGGTSGLAWMMQLLDRNKSGINPPLLIKRQWGWIAAGLVVAILYAVFFGPSIRL